MSEYPRISNRHLEALLGPKVISIGHETSVATAKDLLDARLRITEIEAIVTQKPEVKQ